LQFLKHTPKRTECPAPSSDDLVASALKAAEQFDNAMASAAAAADVLADASHALRRHGGSNILNRLTDKGTYARAILAVADGRLAKLLGIGRDNGRPEALADAVDGILRAAMKRRAA
jgi:hypothetical protein